MSEPAVSPVPLRAGLGTLLRLAGPIVVSRSTQVVVGLCDAAMVAGLGKAALAATTTGAMNTMLVTILPMGICFIVGSFSSQLFGRGDRMGARRFGYYGLMIAAATQVACLAGLPFIAPMLGALGYEADVREQMSAYLSIRLLSGGAMVGMEALASFYGGVGKTVAPMRANVLAMVLNVALNAILIPGNLGAPRLGVAGAAAASSIATWIAFLALLALFLGQARRESGHWVPPLFRAELMRVFRFGTPSGLNWFFEFLAFLFFVNVVVVGLGTTALAAFMTVLQINSFSFMPAFGLASAGAILVGQHIGADRKDEVPRLVRMTFLVSATWQFTVGLFYFFVPALLFAPFARGDDAVDVQALLVTGTRILTLSAAWQLFDSAATVVAESLRAAGDTAFTLWARLAIAWLVFVPGSLISVRVYGGTDVTAVLWLVFYLALLAGVLFLRLRSGAWRRMELIEPAI